MEGKKKKRKEEETYDESIKGKKDGRLMEVRWISEWNDGRIDEQEDGDKTEEMKAEEIEGMEKK